MVHQTGNADDDLAASDAIWVYLGGNVLRDYINDQRLLGYGVGIGLFFQSSSD